MLGQFVTDHPLLGIKDALAAQTDLELSDTDRLGDGDLVTVAGIVASVSRKFTKKGEPFAQFRLEDLTGGVTVIAFPNVYAAVPDLVETDAIVLVKGRADLRGRELQLRAIEIGEPDLGVERRAEPDSVLVVSFSAASCSPAVISRLKQLLAANPGRTPVRVRVTTSDGVRPLDVGSCRVDPGAGLLSELRLLFGPDAATVVPRARRAPTVVAVPEPAPAPAAAPA
jgi:DNA polymerase-3 subunit alpha